MLDRIENPGRTIRPAELEAVCNELGVNLPDDYKDFLLEFNGGSPVPDAFPIKGFEEVGTLQVFFGIDREIESSNLRWNFFQYRSRIPSDHLPIACSDTNDLICLSLSDNRYGSVIFWDSMTESSADTFRNIYEVADSFSGLLKLLYQD